MEASDRSFRCFAARRIFIGRLIYTLSTITATSLEGSPRFKRATVSVGTAALGRNDVPQPSDDICAVVVIL